MAALGSAHGDRRSKADALVKSRISKTPWQKLKIAPQVRPLFETGEALRLLLLLRQGLLEERFGGALRFHERSKCPKPAGLLSRLGLCSLSTTAATALVSLAMGRAPFDTSGA